MAVAQNWIFGYDVLLEVLFAVITLMVAILAFKVYRATRHKQPFFLAWAFLLISISNIFQSILNFLIYTKINENICEIMKIQSIQNFNTVGIYINMFFMVIGLSTLTFMTLKTNDIKGLYLIVGLSLIAVFFNQNPLLMFYLIASILLVIISVYFIKNYLHNKKTKTLLIAIAFIFMLLGNIHFLFAVNHQLFYVIGHFLELVAYSLVLSNFFMVLKR